MQSLRLSALTMALLASAIPAMAQNAPQSNTVGDGSTVHQQVIGDTTSTADHTNSVSTQMGNSANANGAQVNPVIDTRDQNTVTSTGGAATGGAATGNLSNNDNRSNASNGNQTMGQANTGNSSIGNTSATTGNNTNTVGGSNSGGNILGGSSSGGNTLTNGSNTATNTANGGAGGAGGQGGQGGAGGSVLGAGNSTNTNALGQQQGIDRSGNSSNLNANTSANRNTNAQGQGQGQQQAATAAQGQGQQMGQGQNSDNRNNVSGGNQRTSTNVGGQSANTQSGVGQSGNSTVAVDASNRSVSTNNVDARSVYIPQVVAATPPSVVPSTTAVAASTGCGPMQQIIRTPVVGKFYGFFSDNDVPQGWTEDLVPYTELNGKPVPWGTEGAQIVPYITIGGKPFGVMVMSNTAVVGVSGGRNLAIGGGGGSNMSWGQAGGGSSGASQRLVTTLQLRLCQIEEKPTQVIFEQAKPVQPTISRIAE